MMKKIGGMVVSERKRHKLYLKIHSVLLVLVLCMMIWDYDSTKPRIHPVQMSMNEAVFLGVYKDGTVDIMQGNVRKNYRWAEEAVRKTPLVHSAVLLKLEKRNGEWVLLEIEQIQKVQ